MSLTRKCHNHTLQTNPWHQQEETQNTNSHMTSKAIKVKAISSLFLSEMIVKLETTLHAHVRIGVLVRLVQQNKVHIPNPQNNGGNNKQ